MAWDVGARGELRELQLAASVGNSGQLQVVRALIYLVHQRQAETMRKIQACRKVNEGRKSSQPSQDATSAMKRGRK
jgi:hypothetical protein